MRLTRPLLAWLLLPALLTGPVVAQGKAADPVLEALRMRQKRAADDIARLIGKARRLAATLREDGQQEKAALLEEAVRIVTRKRIGIGEVATADGGAHRTLAPLERAMQEMARILDERPDAVEEVQEIGRRVVEALEEVIRVLAGQDEAKSLEEREAALRDARAEAERLARRQAELQRATRNAVPRTAAEQAAERARRDLEALRAQLEELDQVARRDLAALERAREHAARLRELAERQRRLRNETAVRAGKTDTLTPRVNRALAELQALERAARDAQEQALERTERARQAAALAELARRADEIAREIEARSALERAREVLRTGEAEQMRAALDKASAQLTGPEKELVEKAAAEPGSPALRERASQALKQALERLASRETLARDERSLARDVTRAAPELDGPVRKALDAAAKKAAAAAAELEQGREGAQEAREAADALRRAAASLREERPAQGDAAGNAPEREAAERAAALAGELEKLAESREAGRAGMAGSAREAREAVRRAAAEMQDAAEARRAGDARRAEQQARAAAERLERAGSELKEGLSEGEDLPERQRKVARDLHDLAGRPAPDAAGPADEQRELKDSGRLADRASAELESRDYERAGRTQDEVLERLEALARKAEQRAEDAAGLHRGALERAGEATRAAAEQAKRIAGQLDKGARAATGADARERLERAADRTREADNALRRSLRRLKDALPKSAETDRRTAKKQLEEAQRDLEGVRERHDASGAAARQALKSLAERQRKLEDEVKRLEDRLRRSRQQAGVSRLQDAQSAMNEAGRKLEEAEPDEAERAQERARKSLEEAQRELGHEERRYRTLRQYELLFRLKEELKAFRRSAQAHLENLQRIEAEVRRAGRVTRLINRNDVKPLRDDLRTLQRDVTDKGEAIGKEGAVVYTYILSGCAEDLGEVESLLGLKEVGLVPQELLGDVVRRFDLAIRGLERDIREQQQQQQQPGQQPPSRGGKPRLVPPDAEIRMVLVLQESLNEERKRFFENRPEFGTRAPTPGEKARLERLYHRQGSLAELFDSLRESITHPGDEQPEFPGGDSGGEGRR